MQLSRPRSAFASVFLAFFALVATLSACGGGPYMGGPPPGGAWGPPGMHEGPGAAESQSAKCDPKGCSDFCMNMRCMFDEMSIDKCMGVCQSRCGDGFFEEQDAKVMDCVLKVGPDLSCEGEKTCCSEQLTNQLCSE
ncbi:MAG: hypothetical protein U1F43_19310 [Myxococcota bacterium]